MTGVQTCALPISTIDYWFTGTTQRVHKLVHHYALRQPAVEIVVTLPLLAVLLRYVAPAARSFARYPRSMQLLFGVVPLAGYLFDYVTRIYTDLLARGNQAAVEFMPFVCSVAYIVFVLRVSAEERTRSQLEQTRNSLKLQDRKSTRLNSSHRL